MTYNTITIMDNFLAGYRNDHTYRVIVSDYNNNSVSLSGQKATDYIKSTYLNGYLNNNDLPTDSGILPPGVRVVGKNYVVFERPPTHQNVFYNVNTVEQQTAEDYDESENIVVYRIPMPWQIYIATFNKDYYINDVYMFFSNTSLFSSDQEIYLPPLPNFYTSGLLCRPIFAHMEDIERYPKNLSGVVAGAYDWIWNNGTNNDLNEAMVHVNLQIAHDREKRNNTIFSKMPEEIYIKGFLNPYNKVYYHSTQVMSMLKAWEDCSIEEVMNYQWPTFSPDKHFDQNFYHEVNTQDVSEHPNFYNWLREWAFSYYDGEYSEEEIDRMLDESDYNYDSYYEYVVDNHISVSLEKPVFTPYTLSYAISRIQNSENGYNIKNLFNNYIQKAFEISNNQTASA